MTMETPETMEGKKLIVGMIHSNPMEKWDTVGNLQWETSKLWTYHL